MTAEAPLAPGSLVWVYLDPAVGREQGGRRPAVVVSTRDYLAVVDTLAIIVPVTGVDRGWPNHVRIDSAGLPTPSWAMTEQVRTVSRERIVGVAGSVSRRTLDAIRVWMGDFLDIPAG